eukprot:800816-Pelagomonas_calceolata.AAC.2
MQKAESIPSKGFVLGSECYRYLMSPQLRACKGAKKRPFLCFLCFLCFCVGSHCPAHGFHAERGYHQTICISLPVLFGFLFGAKDFGASGRLPAIVGWDVGTSLRWEFACHCCLGLCTLLHVLAWRLHHGKGLSHGYMQWFELDMAVSSQCCSSPIALL